MSVSREWASAAASVNKPKISVAVINMMRRPILSAMGPNSMAPIITPISPAEKTEAKSSTCRPNDREIAGTRKPMT
ncbi:hypothetical protein Aam_051_006 [Acidocella aminolytica 101 = DSM 11237]|uniref:Uncharacterized protein n=1 Tax=Acidocella aminolytica 101 = DSM 11237 TaxID=1120923 RepID=A0A0D6PFT3_9PROT|nr:hypothetical protein Aam_051_006 [Acidocella aminolytica 101 = DSM 11237]